MKIETSIQPRKDGTVRVDIDGRKYEFKADETGAMVADVEEDADIAFLLSRADDFLPADDADFAAADALLKGSAPVPEDDDPDDDLDEDPEDMNAAPVEEPASVVAAPGAKPKGARAKAQK